eukprot:g14862.t1
MANPQPQPALSTAAALDHAHVWHPFTPMRQWREADPTVIESAESFYLIDDQGNRYLDGVSSLWCNVHGHRVPAIDNAIRKQLDKVAHSTMLGLTHEPAAQFAAMLIERINRNVPESIDEQDKLNKVFYSDAGATAVEVAFKMAVGYWFHQGKPEKNKFIGLAGAYHGDTTGTMSVGYSDLFHKPFLSMVFDVTSFPSVDALRDPGHSTYKEAICGAGNHLCKTCDAKTEACNRCWPSECEAFANSEGFECIQHLERLLQKQSDETAAICIEPIMQGAAGMVCQPPGFVAAVARLAKKYDVLLILDEVATGFGRTGEMFAFESEAQLSQSYSDGETDFRFTSPDILCLAKGITGGYLPLAATVCSDKIEQAFTGELEERKTLYHGHTYTGNPLACTAAIASLELFDQPTDGSPDLITHTQHAAELIADRLNALRGDPNVLDIRQRGLMVGIELGQRDAQGNVEPFNFANPIGKQACDSLRPEGILIRPLGNVVVLMPPPAMPLSLIDELVSKTGPRINEAPLPEGWPELTPVGEIEVKSYPVYRAAVIDDGTNGSQNGMFRPLFNHIQREDIAMTAPVEMTYDGEEQSSMAFLYRNPEMGSLGSDTDDQRVVVIDIPRQTAVSIGVRGRYNTDNYNEALAELNAWLEENKDQWRAAGEPRLLGYNSPFVPGSMRYGEVQVPIEPVDP